MTATIPEMQLLQDARRLALAHDSKGTNCPLAIRFGCAARMATAKVVAELMTTSRKHETSTH
jgi:hypothetical protein